jgi:hypothetical protein
VLCQENRLSQTIASLLFGKITDDQGAKTDGAEIAGLGKKEQVATKI